MAEIDVRPTGEDDDAFTFEVVVNEAGSSSRHVVSLQRADAAELRDGSTRKELLRRCFEFLLEREPKESILAQFDVRDIGRYFPEFHIDQLLPER